MKINVSPEILDGISRGREALLATRLEAERALLARRHAQEEMIVNIKERVKTAVPDGLGRYAEVTLKRKPDINIISHEDILVRVCIYLPADGVVICPIINYATVFLPSMRVEFGNMWTVPVYMIDEGEGIVCDENHFESPNIWIALSMAVDQTEAAIRAFGEE